MQSYSKFLPTQSKKIVHISIKTYTIQTLLHSSSKLNGMLRHSLVTLEGDQDFDFFTEPYYPENLPSLFCCRELFSFLALQQCACTLAGLRACPRDCNECRHMGEVQEKYSYVSSLFLSTFGGCVSRTPLSCRKFSL